MAMCCFRINQKVISYKYKHISDKSIIPGEKKLSPMDLKLYQNRNGRNAESMH